MPHGGGTVLHWPYGSQNANSPGGPDDRMLRRPVARHDVGSRAATLYAGGYEGGFGVYRPDVHQLGESAGYRSDGRMQSAGAITPVSSESRQSPRSQGNGAMRSGSIRADVARYNEERGAARAMQRPTDYQRPPDNTPYRN